MAKIKKQSGAEVFVDLIALFPWWVGVALALVTFFALHYFAAQPITNVPTAAKLGANLTHGLFHAFAVVGQYLVPLICMLGAGLSVWKQNQRTALLKQTVVNPAVDSLDHMTWREFEMLVGESFRCQGYQVAETGDAGADGGVDLILSKNNEKFLVQCKQWKAYKVSVEVVRELYGVMAAKGAAGGMVVTSGRFTEPAIEFAKGRNIKLINGDELHAMIRETKMVSPDLSEPTTNSIRENSRPIQRPVMLNSPDCPLCSKQMVQRQARRGQNAGKAFWGCSRFPACRGVLSEAG